MINCIIYTTILYLAETKKNDGKLIRLFIDVMYFSSSNACKKMLDLLRLCVSRKALQLALLSFFRSSYSLRLLFDGLAKVICVFFVCCSKRV